MKLHSLSLGITLFILTISCQKSSKITVNFDAMETKEYSVYNIENELFQSLSENDSVFSIPLETGVFLTLSKNFEKHTVFVKPEETITLDTLSTKPYIVGAVGEVSAENEFLNAYAKTLKNLNSRDLFGYYGKEADSFKILLKEYNKPIVEKSTALKAMNNIDEEFKSAMLLKMEIDQYTPYLNYEDYYAYNNGTPATIDSTFYAPIEGLNLTDVQHLNFQKSLDFIKKWHTKNIDYSEYDSVGAFYDGLTKALQESFGPGLLADFFNYHQIAEQIGFGKGIDKSQDDIAKFKENTTNTTLLSLLDEKIKPWKPLMAGNMAPEYVAETIEGDAVTSTDLQGKKVYIDVWATWCGPCIREIPALKALEEELKDEQVQFVSISIDQLKDKEKWKNFVAEKELGGIQLIVDGAWKSDFAQTYNVTGIPRFMIFDADGTIIDANAPRPSDPIIKETLLN